LVSLGGGLLLFIRWVGGVIPHPYHHPKNKTTNPTTDETTPKTPTVKTHPTGTGRGSLIFDVMGFPALMMPWGG